MEENRKKILTVAFIATAFITAIVVDVLMETLGAAWGKFNALYALDSVKHGVPAAIGILTFCLLQFNKKVVLWGEDVVVELTKVVWPTKKETTQGTIVCCVMLVISGVVLGLFDFVSTQAVKMIIN